MDSDRKIAELKAMGVRDCKAIPDERTRILSEKIKKLCGRDGYEVVGIYPPRYNTMYADIGNMNTILAWAHAESLEVVLKKNPECDLAISDQFAWKTTLINKLKTKGKKIQVIQRPKAEENIAVAAASILARARFLEVMDDMQKRFKHHFSKGANAHVISEAVEFLKNGGRIEDVAKVHFKTTKEVMTIFSKIKQQSN